MRFAFWSMPNIVGYSYKEMNMAYEAQFVARDDQSVQSDWIRGDTQAAAKAGARANLQEKYNANQHWRDHYGSFDNLLAAVESRTQVVQG